MVTYCDILLRRAESCFKFKLFSIEILLCFNQNAKCYGNARHLCVFCAEKRVWAKKTYGSRISHARAKTRLANTHFYMNQNATLERVARLDDTFLFRHH